MELGSLYEQTGEIDPHKYGWEAERSRSILILLPRKLELRLRRLPKESHLTVLIKSRQQSIHSFLQLAKNQALQMVLVTQV